MRIEKGKLYYDTANEKVFKQVMNTCEIENHLISNKIAVHCKTQEDWDYVSNVLNYDWSKFRFRNRWLDHKETSCLNINSQGFGSYNSMIEKGYNIITIEEFKQLMKNNAISNKNDDNVQNKRHKGLDKAKDILYNIPNDLTAKFGTGGDMMLTLDMGTKESSNKLNYELDFDFITQMSQRMQTNKGKYEPYNWKKPIDVESLKQALFRHVIEVMKGNYQDDGRLHGHLESISCNAMMLNYQLKSREG